MVDMVLIEVTTALPEWIFSWGHIAVLACLLIIVPIIAAILYNRDVDGIGEIAGFIWFFSLIAAALWLLFTVVLFGGERVIPDEEAERVATEISEVTEVEVTPEQVQDMKRGKYIPGVNYEKMTDSEGDLVFKVEVG